MTARNQYYLLIVILCGFVDGEMIASNRFVILTNSPKSDGLWIAVATCAVSFPGTSFKPNETWMVARFGVPIVYYEDHLSGGDTEVGPSGKWVISRNGYGSDAGHLNYGLTFEYDVWIDSQAPSGDCRLFIGKQAAEDFIQSAAELTDTPADTLITTVPLTIDFSSTSGAQGRCVFSFQGITIGAREGVILVNFTVPVDYITDYIGNTVLKESDDKTWYIVLFADAIRNVAYYIMNYKYTTTNDDVSNAICLLYVSQADAEARARGTSAPVTTTQFVTTTQPIQPVILTRTSFTTTTETSTFSAATSLSPWIYTIPQKPGYDKTSGYLIESMQMRNKFVHELSLWTKTEINLIQCVRMCLADDICVSLFFNAGNVSCTGHRVVYHGGNSVEGVVYYVLPDQI